MVPTSFNASAQSAKAGAQAWRISHAALTWQRSLEVIGEAVKNLPGEFRAAHSEVEWRSIAGMRDRLIHGYFGIDYQFIWDVVQEKLPELKRNIQRIIDLPQT